MKKKRITKINYEAMVAKRVQPWEEENIILKGQLAEEMHINNKLRNIIHRAIEDACGLSGDTLENVSGRKEWIGDYARMTLPKWTRK